MGKLTVPRRNWREAGRAFMRLVRDPYDTPAVIDLIHALDGPTVFTSYLRLLRSEEGGAVAYRRTELGALLKDPAWLAAFAPGTFGAAYRAFMAAQPFTAGQLERLAHEGYNERDLAMDHPVAWLARRATDVHDLWHVLTGYGADILGESCVVAFSFAQTRSWGYAAVGVGGYLTLKIPEVAAGRRAIREAFWNGARAAWLLEVDYEAALALPLEEARARLRVATPRHYREAEDARH